jgi:hypothetical protein
VAAGEQVLVGQRERVGRVAQQARPAVGDRREVAVERAAQLRDRGRQRVLEVAVAAVPEAVAGHVDGGAEAAAVEEVGEVRALSLVQQRLADREPARVELVGEVNPGERVDARGEGALGGEGGHAGRAIRGRIS